MRVEATAYERDAIVGSNESRKDSAEEEIDCDGGSAVVLAH